MNNFFLEITFPQRFLKTPQLLWIPATISWVKPTQMLTLYILPLMCSQYLKQTISLHLLSLSLCSILVYSVALTARGWEAVDGHAASLFLRYRPEQSSSDPPAHHLFFLPLIKDLKYQMSVDYWTAEMVTGHLSLSTSQSDPHGCCLDNCKSL